MQKHYEDYNIVTSSNCNDTKEDKIPSELLNKKHKKHKKHSKKDKKHDKKPSKKDMEDEIEILRKERLLREQNESLRIKQFLGTINHLID